MRQRLFATFSLIALAGACGTLVTGCGGGGSSALPRAAGQAPGAPTPASTSSPASAQSIVVRITIPAAGSNATARRRPNYISVHTQSATIAIDGGTPLVVDLAANSPNCQASAGGGRTCSATVSAPVGSDTFSEATYASTDGTGAALSRNTTTATIVAGQANSVSLTLDGIVASIVLTLAKTNPPQGTATSIPLTATMYDASSAAIIGGDPFENPVTLTNSDASGATKLSTTTLNSASDAANLSVTYNGAAISAIFGATAANVAPQNVTSATLTSVNAGALVDWPTYAFDSQRSGYNPYSTGITPASIANIKVGWSNTNGGFAQSQPIVITNVAGHSALVVVAHFATAEAFDAFNGSVVWQKTLPTQDVQSCGTAGISGTAVYDRGAGAIFMAAGNGGGAPNHVLLYKLDPATGNTLGQVDVTPNTLSGEANSSHAGLTLADGLVYVGTGSDCEGGKETYVSWRGSVVAVNPASMQIAGTFLSTWQNAPPGGDSGNYGGGGVWGWGGVASDANGNVYVATGNAETRSATGSQPASPPFAVTNDEQAGFAEHLVQISGDLSTVRASNYPGFDFTIGQGDLDYTGTPVVYQPAGCPELTATQGKGGILVINDAQGLNEVNRFKFSVPDPTAAYMGNPAYSPATGYLYAAISASGNGSAMLPPGLAAIGGCGSTVQWTAQFGPDSALYSTNGAAYPRSAPTVTAGGVVFIATPCTQSGSTCAAAGGTPGGALWAIDASSGSVLNGGKPILFTPDAMRMAPTADGLWLWVYDESGNMYALTVDPNVHAASVQRGSRRPASFKVHG